MIISASWLSEWIGLELSPQHIADCLTAAGLEVDAVQDLVGELEHVVVGEVLQLSEHPNADKLRITLVDVGDEQLNIVCGAKNVHEGMRVAVAKIGAKLPNGMRIKRAKMRGVESNGMLCSAAELGLEEESSGLIALDYDAQIGQRVDDYLQLDDSLIDIDLTPNRGDCLSVQGIARELHSLLGGNYHPLDIPVVEPSVDHEVKLEVTAQAFCPLYIVRAIKGVNPQAKTPLWMQEKLRRSGVRSISAIVDITNFVMLELGQPMHAFDASKVQQITVRMAHQGERIQLLDENEVDLQSNTLVIADEKAPIAIAGVMGGLHSGINDSSSDIILEAAHFTRKAVAGIARQYGLHTDSSHRFERGVDPLLPYTAMERACELVQEICGGEVAQNCVSVADDGFLEKAKVQIRLPRLNKLLGFAQAQKEVGQILSRIAQDVDYAEDTWTVTPPSYRFDIECEADLVEEIARVKSYASIPTAIPSIAPNFKQLSRSDISVRQIKHTMVARDYHEVINYSFVDPSQQALCSQEKAVELINPIAENLSVMRTSLLPGLLSALQFNNNRQQNRIRLFETGATYHQAEQGFIEKQRLAGIVCGERRPIQWAEKSGVMVDYFDIKSDVESILNLTIGEKSIIFKEFQHIAMHPRQVSSVNICKIEGSAEEIAIGWLGQVHPTVSKQFGLDFAVFAFEFDLTGLMQTQLAAFKGVSRFPSTKRDVSIVLAQRFSSSELLQSVKQCLHTVLESVTIFDVYTGEGVPDGEKSISLRLSLHDKTQTMTEEQIEETVNRLLSSLQQQFDARLRS